MMNSFTRIISLIPLHWWIVLAVCALGIAAICVRALETDASRSRRARRKKEKEVGLLTERICIYARDTHRQFPTGDVVVSEQDLAEQLRKHPETIVTALNLLVTQQKAQRAPLDGYWKLNA
jgi:hypothetical protein